MKIEIENDEWIFAAAAVTLCCLFICMAKGCQYQEAGFNERERIRQEAKQPTN